MSTDPNYPTGALQALVANRAGHLHIYGTDDHFCRLHLDALAAMPPEDRAALARWVWPEGHELMATRVRVALDAGEKDCAVLRKRLVEAEAATVKRITEWLRGLPGAVGCFASAEDVAATIEREFGGQRTLGRVASRESPCGISAVITAGPARPGHASSRPRNQPPTSARTGWPGACCGRGS